MPFERGALRKTRSVREHAEMRQSYGLLAETWTRLPAQTECDETLLQALAEIEASEAHEALPLALQLRSWRAVAQGLQTEHSDYINLAERMLP
jgi:hypothetical protein